MDAVPEQQTEVRVNCTIDGDPAQWLLELKHRGIVSSNKEAFVQGLCALHRQFVRLDAISDKINGSKGKRVLIGEKMGTD